MARGSSGCESLPLAGILGGSGNCGGSGGGAAALRALRTRRVLLTGVALLALVFAAGWRLGHRDAEAEAQAQLLRLEAYLGDTVFEVAAPQADAGRGGGSVLAAPEGDRKWCAFGARRGTWVSDAPPGARWRLLDPACQLRNMLVLYGTAGPREAADVARAAGGLQDADGGAAAAANAAAAAGQGTAEDSSNGGDGGGGDGGGAPAEAPAIRLLLLSDSVDRYITGHLCEWVGGVQEAQVAHEMLPAAAAAGGAPPDSGGSVPVSTSPRRRQRRRLVQLEQQAAAPAQPPAAGGWQQQQQEQQQQGASQPSSQELQQEEQQAAAEAAGAAAPAAQQASTSSPAAPTNVYTTAYSLHKCVSSTPLRMASSYFPGVHPAGPWHRNLAQSFRARIDSAATLWRDYAGNEAPHLVSVSALLWDLARLWFHERHEVEGPELSPRLLEGWMANFTQVVRYAREAFPETKVWVTHTTLPPRFKALTGVSLKPYLGRHYYVNQLNNALVTVARMEGLQLVDYEQVGARFMANQTYLVDQIHPGSDVGLEIANIYLNLAAQALGSDYDER